MKTKALVLGGGGTVGIAWEVGVAVGLLEHGVDLRAADLLVGTSAGSVVGSFLALGFDPTQVLAVQKAMAATSQQSPMQMDLEGYQKVSAVWQGARAMDQETSREIGSLALQSRGMDEAAWVGQFGLLVGSQGGWPEKPLCVTAVDTETGELAVWDRSSGVPLHLAVAASCCVPGLFQPVTIGGRRYMDGGVWSGTHADQAAGHDTVLVVAPMGSAVYPLGHSQLMAEVERLRAAGSTVEVLLPDATTQAGFGPSMMDQTRVGGAAENGIRQGRELGARLAEIWH